jgi:diacylglycerol kinase
MKNVKKITKNPTFWKSILIAAGGFKQVVKSEKKIRLGFAVAAVCVALAIWVKASYVETILVLFAWIQVIVGEIFNTSLEKAMDYASDKGYHPLIKRGKDYAAASVFVLSVLAACISLFILGVRYYQGAPQ